MDAGSFVGVAAMLCGQELWKREAGATGKSVAGTCRCKTIARVPHVVVLALSTMSSNSTSGSSSIFNNGKLNPGIYKIQSIFTQTYLDIEVHSRDVCCRPAKDLEEGRGLVRQCLLSAVHASDDQQWEIKQFGRGYTVQRVSLPKNFNVTPTTACEQR